MITRLMCFQHTYGEINIKIYTAYENIISDFNKDLVCFNINDIHNMHCKLEYLFLLQNFSLRSLESIQFRRVATITSKHPGMHMNFGGENILIQINQGNCKMHTSIILNVIEYKSDEISF